MAGSSTSSLHPTSFRQTMPLTAGFPMIACKHAVVSATSQLSLTPTSRGARDPFHANTDPSAASEQERLLYAWQRIVSGLSVSIRMIRSPLQTAVPRSARPGLNSLASVSAKALDSLDAECQGSVKGGGMLLTVPVRTPSYQQQCRSAPRTRRLCGVHCTA